MVVDKKKNGVYQNLACQRTCLRSSHANLDTLDIHLLTS